MYFDTVKISGLEVTYQTSDLDRVPKVTEPNAGCGYYHYDKDSITKEQAFETLKQAMIANLEDDIRLLETELSKLKELQP